MTTKSRFKVEYRKSPPLVTVAVIAAIALSVMALLTVHIAIADTRAQTQALGEEAARLEQDNNRLDRDLAELGTVQGVIRVAQEQLGLVSSDTVIFQPEE